MKKNKFSFSLKHIFSYKNNVFLFILSFIVSLGTLLGIGFINYSQTSNNYYHSDFSDNTSICYSKLHNYTDTIESKINGLNYAKIYSSNDSVTITNLTGFSTTAKVYVYGVDAGFENYALKSTDSELTYRHTGLDKGSSFTAASMLQNELSMMMYSSQAGLFKTNDGRPITFTINDQSFSLIGTLKDTADVQRTINDLDVTIHVFIPYTTFLEIFQANFGIYYSIDNEGYMLSDLKQIAQTSIFSYIDNFQVQGRKTTFDRTFYEIEFLLILLSFISVLVVGILNIKNRSNEIGVRRAVGASRDDISFMFLSEGSLMIVSSALIAFLLCFTGFALASTYLSRIHFIYILFFDFKDSLLALSAFIGSSLVGILISSLIGSFTNISSILVEEH